MIFPYRKVVKFTDDYGKHKKGDLKLVRSSLAKALIFEEKCAVEATQKEIDAHMAKQTKIEPPKDN